MGSKASGQGCGCREGLIAPLAGYHRGLLETMPHEIDERRGVSRAAESGARLLHEPGEFSGMHSGLSRKKLRVVVRHPLGKLTYAFDKKNSEKIKGWLSTPAAQTT